MSKVIGATCKLFCFVVLFLLVGRAFAEDFGLSLPEIKSLRVEYTYIYSARKYINTTSRPVGAVVNVSQDSPEHALLKYFSLLAGGNVDAAVGMWTQQSQKLIRNKNSSFSQDELKRAAQGMYKGRYARMVNRIDYGNYIIIESALEGSPADQKNNPEGYALKKEDGGWKLTQDLADDPVMCCWKNEAGRITRLGVPGGDFVKVLESLK